MEMEMERQKSTLSSAQSQHCDQDCWRMNSPIASRRPWTPSCFIIQTHPYPFPLSALISSVRKGSKHNKIVLETMDHFHLYHATRACPHPLQTNLEIVYFYGTPIMWPIKTGTLQCQTTHTHARVCAHTHTHTNIYSKPDCPRWVNI